MWVASYNISTEIALFPYTFLCMEWSVIRNSKWYIWWQFLPRGTVQHVYQAGPMYFQLRQLNLVDTVWSFRDLLYFCTPAWLASVFRCTWFSCKWTKVECLWEFKNATEWLHEWIWWTMKVCNWYILLWVKRKRAMMSSAVHIVCLCSLFMHVSNLLCNVK